MFFKLITCVVFVCFINLSNSTFRCDYTYFPEGGGWYKLHSTLAQWHFAKELCQHEGGDLVQPSTKEQLQLVMELIQSHGIDTPVHTGFRVFFVVQGDNADPENLLENTIPVRKKSNVKEQVLVLWNNGTLEQTDTFMWYPFVCHMPMGETIRLNQCGTIDNEYILDQRTDHCYKFHRTRSTWHDALLICAAEGGNLAIINSEKEAEVIKDVFTRNPPEIIPGDVWVDSAFLGFTLSADGVWVTTQGLTLPKSGYVAWSPGEPNNARGDEFCGSVGRNGLLFDDPCTRLLPFICELERDSLLYCDSDKMREDTKILLREILKGKVDIY